MSRVLIANVFKDESWFAMCHRLAHELAKDNEVVYMSFRPFYKEPVSLMDGKLTVYSWTSKARPTGMRDAIHFIRIYLRHRPQIVIGHFVGSNICIPLSKVLSLFQVRTFEWYHTLSRQIELDGTGIPFFRKLRRRLFYRFFCDTVVPVSEMAARDYRAVFGLRNYKVVLNAIKDEYRGVDANFSQGKIKVGFIGRFLAHKGLDVLIDLIEGLPPDRFTFHIAGEGPQKKKLETRVGENVIMEGLLPYFKIREFIEGCHVIVVPSYADAFNVVGIENLMLKRCLVLSSMTGLSEYLKDQEDAIICNPNAEEFKAALMRLDADRILMSRISSKGRETFLERFSTDAHIKNVKKLIFDS